MGATAAGATALGVAAGASAFVPKVEVLPTTAGELEAGSADTAKRGGPIPVPTNWTQTADVVVVGYGGAGAVAAVTAYDAGASVLILEKTPSFASLGFTTGAATQYPGGGGSTSMDGGGAECVTDPIAAGNYIYQGSWGMTPLSVCQALAWMITETPAWLTQMGIKYTTSASTPEFPALAGSSSGLGSLSLVSGNVFFTSLNSLVQSRNIPVLFSTEATDLIQDPNTNEILGVQALANNSEVLNIKAARAVILTTGSIEFNEDLKSDNFRCYPAHFYGWQFCTGDSVKMASKVGAAMWHMGAMSARMVPWFPEYPVAYSTTAPSQYGWVYVDKNGNRYANETLLTAHSHSWWVELADFDLTVPQYTRVPSFIIFDETCRKAGAITSGPSGLLPTYIDPRPAWSSDNSAEIAKGWIQTGTTIAALAAAINATPYAGLPQGSNNTGPAAKTSINMSATNLTNTLNNYNAFCAAKVDSQFGRPASTLVPIVTPPFYAMALWPGGPSAFGGPVRNAEGQVCDADGNPIPRLYAAGENGSIGGFLFIVSNNGQIIALGRVAGNNAAAETPWS